jgi:hypothetical protein
MKIEITVEKDTNEERQVFAGLLEYLGRNGLAFTLKNKPLGDDAPQGYQTGSDGRLIPMDNCE